jgi:hypothetical protein
MKTRGLSRFSMLLMSMMTGGSEAIMGTKPPVTLHSHGSFHRRGKLKGWMKERKRCTFNKNR